jgi:hypothetical protein
MLTMCVKNNNKKICIRSLIKEGNVASFEGWECNFLKYILYKRGGECIF